MNDLQHDRVRKQVFSKPIPYDYHLMEVSKKCDSHDFLINPSGQNVYLYLTEYVRTIAEFYFPCNFRNLKILDWGCGKGHVSYLLKKMGIIPVSCDIKNDKGDSSFNQETPIIDKHNIIVTPLSHEYKLPFQTESMDIVLSFGVLEHVPNDFESLREINRILRPSGLFFCFNLPYILSWTQRLAHFRKISYHENLYSKSKILKLLHNSGFNILDIWYRQLLPKNSVRYPKYRWFERLDQFFTEHTIIKYFATYIEFIACKGSTR